MKVLSYQQSGYLDSSISVEDFCKYADSYLGTYIKFLPNLYTNFSKAQKRVLRIFSRKDMPVLDNKHINLLKDFLENSGIPYRVGTAPVSYFKSIQKDLYIDKALSNVTDIVFKKQDYSTLICDKNGYLLDGNHRWFAYMLLNPSKRVKALQIDYDYKTLIPILVKYSHIILEEEARE